MSSKILNQKELKIKLREIIKRQRAQLQNDLAACGLSFLDAAKLDQVDLAIYVSIRTMQGPAQAVAYLAYDHIGQAGWTGSQEFSEVHDRLCCGAAQIGFELGGQPFVYCSVHSDEYVMQKLNDEGFCDACDQAEEQAGMDAAEARAERLSEAAGEHDDDSPLEESLAYISSTPEDQQAEAERLEQEQGFSGSQGVF